MNHNTRYFYISPNAPEQQISGVQYVSVNDNDLILENGTSGELVQLPNIQREWLPRKYYYPIPQVHIQRNPNLTQNPGWE